MAFLDKLTDAAAAIGDKASDAVEITKIKTKISGEKKDVEAELAKLGRIYYEKAKAGEELTPGGHGHRHQCRRPLRGDRGFRGTAFSDLAGGSGG